MITLKSYAKINLGLEVLGKRNDGFHDISSIVCKIDLFDLLHYKISKKNMVIQSGIEEEENIVFKVLNYMTQKFKITQKLNITIEKNIPYSSGMGGGSSNAAATIDGINKILNLNLDSKEKFDIALKFGSDTPFFLAKGTANISGRGDKISFINSPKNKHIVVFYPKYEIKDKTKRIFSTVTSYTNGNKQKSISSKINNNEYLLGPFFNGLEASAIENFSNLNLIKNNLINLGITNVSMTGAGPTFYSLQSSIEEVEEIKNKVDNTDLDLKTFKAKII